MVGAILSGVGALGSAIYGAVASAQQNKAARNLIQQQRDDNRAWYNIRYNQDYTQRADAQQLLAKQKEMLQDYAKNASATAAVAGGSDEAVAVQKAAANKAVADTTSNIAANAAAEKDRVESTYRQQDAALNQQQANIKAQQAQATAQAAAQAVNAGIGLAGNLIGNPSMERPADRLASLGIQSPEELAATTGFKK